MMGSALAQLPETQQQYWAQVDEQMRQQEQQRWAAEQAEMGWPAEDDEYYQEEPGWPGGYPQRDPMSTMFNQAAAMAVTSHDLLDDQELLKLRKGFWEFHSLDGQYASAMYIQAQGIISVHGPGGGYDGALLMLWGPDIPAPAKLSLIPVTLKQNDYEPVTVQTFNLGFPRVQNWGTLIFVVPSGKALVENMEDIQRFQATIDGKVVFSAGWHDGSTARSKLATELKLEPAAGQP